MLKIEEESPAITEDCLPPTEQYPVINNAIQLTSH